MDLRTSVLEYYSILDICVTRDTPIKKPVVHRSTNKVKAIMTPTHEDLCLAPLEPHALGYLHTHDIKEYRRKPSGFYLLPAAQIVLDSVILSEEEKKVLLNTDIVL